MRESGKSVVDPATVHNKQKSNPLHFLVKDGHRTWKKKHGKSKGVYGMMSTSLYGIVTSMARNISVYVVGVSLRVYTYER